MKSRILIYSVICIFTLSCSSDPCEAADNVECETGDADGDGILNLADVAPSDPCSPNENNLNCPTGDFDDDEIINSEDAYPEDACLPFDNLMCPTGDLDADGIINSEDIAPLDDCNPIKPPLSEIIIGEWSWHIGTSVGKIKFNLDGTYEDIQNKIFPYDDSFEKTWLAENDAFLELNKNPLETKSLKCHLIVFVGFSGGDFIFIKL